MVKNVPALILLAILISSATGVTAIADDGDSTSDDLVVVDKTTSYIVSVDGQTPQAAPASYFEDTSKVYSDCGGNDVKENETAIELFQFQKCFLAGTLKTSASPQSEVTTRAAIQGALDQDDEFLGNGMRELRSIYASNRTQFDSDKLFLGVDQNKNALCKLKDAIVDAGEALVTKSSGGNTDVSDERLQESFVGEVKFDVRYMKFISQKPDQLCKDASLVDILTSEMKKYSSFLSAKAQDELKTLFKKYGFHINGLSVAAKPPSDSKDGPFCLSGEKTSWRGALNPAIHISACGECPKKNGEVDKTQIEKIAAATMATPAPNSIYLFNKDACYLVVTSDKKKASASAAVPANTGVTDAKVK